MHTSSLSSNTFYQRKWIASRYLSVFFENRFCRAMLRRARYCYTAKSSVRLYLSVRLLRYISFTQYWNTVKNSCFVEILLYTYTNEQWSNSPTKIKVLKRVQAKVIWNENAKIVFAHIFVKSGVDLHQSNTEMIFGQLYTYRKGNWIILLEFY